MKNTMSKTNVDLLEILAKREGNLVECIDRNLMMIRTTDSARDEDRLNDLVLKYEEELENVRKQIAQIKEAL